MIFLNPESDPLGAGYNIIQSKIAIGSGGMFGKGLFNGTQSHLKFLPEYHTDFIFSFLSEELGLIGVLILLILYSSLFIIMAYMTFRVKTKFAMMLIIGSSVMIFSHVFINIAMVMGLLPVVGIPLPFISYGGTMMLSSWVAIALSMNAIIHHNTRFLF
jgi:rod shape determining protein RodA